MVATTMKTHKRTTGRPHQPCGFQAGDANLYRYVGNSPTNATDPSGLKSKKEWQALANQELGPSPATMDPIERNQKITAAYAKMFFKKQGRVYLWAGLAALASKDVGRGMKRVEPLIKPLGKTGNQLLEINSAIHGEPSPEQLLRILALGNWELFNDVYWQHLAYDSGGIDEIKKLRENREIPREQYNAWVKIAEGEANNNESDILTGNALLLEYEQKVTLQNSVYDKYPKQMNWVGMSVESPVAGGAPFIFSFLKEKEFSDKDDRWEWVGAQVYFPWIIQLRVSRQDVEAELQQLINAASK